MNRDEFDALPLGTEFTVTTACPNCGVRGGVEGKIMLIADKPQGALAGTHPKLTMHRGAMMTCTSCGYETEGAPK